MPATRPVEGSQEVTPEEPAHAGGLPAAAAGADAAGAPRSPAAEAPATRRTRVKVCGITNLGDARLACELGAWAIGMIFYERSPRSCSREQAALVCGALRRRCELCGVYVNPALERVVRDVDELGLTLVQLHGEEGPAFCAEIARRSGAKVIKAAQVSTAGDVRGIERFHTDYHLLDARPRVAAARELRGGTGETFDWGLLGERSSRVPLILSGGLNPHNAGAAIAAARPFALDTASGTEAAPGHKDPALVHAFFDAVRAAGEGDEQGLPQ